MRLIDPLHVLASHLSSRNCPDPSFRARLKPSSTSRRRDPTKHRGRSTLGPAAPESRRGTKRRWRNCNADSPPIRRCKARCRKSLMEALVRLGRTDEGVRILESTLATLTHARAADARGLVLRGAGRPKAALSISGARSPAIAAVRTRCTASRSASGGCTAIATLFAATETFIRLRGPGRTGAHYYICTLIDVGAATRPCKLPSACTPSIRTSRPRSPDLAVARLHQHRYDDAARIAEAEHEARRCARSPGMRGERLLALGEPESALARVPVLAPEGDARVLVDDVLRVPDRLGPRARAHSVATKEAFAKSRRGGTAGCRERAQPSILGRGLARDRARRRRRRETTERAALRPGKACALKSAALPVHRVRSVRAATGRATV